MAQILQVLDFELFTIGGTTVTVSTVAVLLFAVVATFWISRVLRMIVERTLSRRGGRPGVIGTVSGFIHYAVLVVGFSVVIQTLGINLSALFAAGAIFAIGLGFAMQSIAQNFVAGVILLAERTIKPGDIVEVEGRKVKVFEMGIRASIARTRDGEDLIIPNSTLIQTAVKNFTLRSRSFRIRVPVGVVYRSDMALVRETLEAAAAEASKRWSVSGHQPAVFMTGFGSHSVNWEVGVWVDDPWEWRPAVSHIHESIWNELKAKDIVIAFPQLDVHFDPPVADSFERLAVSRAG